MIGYVTLGCRDMDQSKAFYGQLLALLGAQLVLDLGRLALFGASPEQPMLAVCTPFDGQPASAGNGVMVALKAESRAQVDELHAKALELGALCEGAPGERMPGFYIAYFRDQDGNKLAAYKQG